MKEENAPAQTADADLPPQVQADQYLLETEKALQNSDAQTAKTAFGQIEALNIEEPPPDFFFLYGKFLMENCNVANLAKAVENGQVQNFLDNLLKARSLPKQFLTQVQRTAANYKPALELLSACQSTIKPVTSAAKKRAGETLLIHLAAGYTELVNTIIGAEDCAASVKIHLAAGYTEIASSLLNAATDVHAKNDNDETPLHKAAEKGQFQVVEALLAAGANVNAEYCDDRPPLHVAAWQGHVEVVKVLLAAGVDVDAEDKERQTPLHLAADKGHVEVVKSLLTTGANVHARNEYGRTPLQVAALLGNTKVEEALLASGANVLAKNKYGETPLQPQILHWNPVNPSPMLSVRFFGRSLGHPVAYQWEINGEPKGEELDFEWKFSSEGEFSVVFSAQNENGKWFPSDPQTLIVREPQAIVNFRANPKTYHHNQVVQFSNESQGNFASFRWDFGDGQTSAERSPQHQYENDGDNPKTFRVQLVGKHSNGQEIRSPIYNLTVLPSPPTLVIPPPPIPPPQAAIGFDRTSKIEVGQTLRFLDESVGLIQSWQWNFNDEGSSMDRHPEFTFQTPGDKTITLTVKGDGEDQSTDSLSMVIRPAPPKGWLQRFWWILIPALFLFLIFGKILREIKKARNAPLVPPNKKMRVEISEVSKSGKGNKPNASQNLKLLKTFVLEMMDKIYLSQAEATADGAGDKLVCDLRAKGCYLQRHSHLGFFSPGNDGKPRWLKSFSDQVEITDDFGVKKTLQVDISEETMPETF